jgi:hypothetical protein
MNRPIIDSHIRIRCHHDNAFVFLRLLQEVADLNVHVAVVSIFDVGALAKKRVGFIEKDDRVAALRYPEDAAEILLRFPDVSDCLLSGHCFFTSVELSDVRIAPYVFGVWANFV